MTPPSSRPGAETVVEAYARTFQRILQRTGVPHELNALLAAHVRRGGKRSEAVAAIDLLRAEGVVRFVVIGEATAGVEFCGEVVQ